MKRTGLYVSLWRIAQFCLTLAIVCSIAACSDEDEDGTPYPPLLTELGDFPSDNTGIVHTFRCDNGTEYQLETTLTANSPNTVYRQLCTYETIAASSPTVRVHSLGSVHILRDSTERTQAADPTTVTSVWRGGAYINLMVNPRTQGGKQYWGYRTDSLHIIRGNRRCLFLSLHHNANNDPASYSTTIYASIPLKELKQIQPGDSVVLKAFLPTGLKAWRFLY